MHILILPSWYPSSYNPYPGMFVHAQAKILAKSNKVGIIAILPIGIRNIIDKKKLDLSFKKFEEDNISIYRKQYLDFKNEKILKKIKKHYFFKLFDKYIKENGKPDIIHVHSFSIGEFAIEIKENYNIPYVVTEHLSSFTRNSISKKDLELSKSVFSKSSYNIAVSKKFSTLLSEKFNLNFNYLPNVVDTIFFTLKADIENKCFKFINIAMLDKNKNQEMLIKSFAKTFKNLKNVKLTIVGDGEEFKNLELLINRLNMNEQISLFGKANRNEVKELLHESDVFVLSSKKETFGVVLIEALSCGLPVISTKSGGPESIITFKELGLVCDITIESLGIQLKHIYDNFEYYDKHIIRKHVEENYSAEVIKRKLISVYNEIIER